MLPLLSLIHFIVFALAADVRANIAIHPITDVNEAHRKGYFSDPFHVPVHGSHKIYISGTTHAYLKCNSSSLLPKCATRRPIKYNTSDALVKQAHDNGAHICSSAGIHPFQSGPGANGWDAVVTLHVQDNPDCEGEGIKGWSVIAHARRAAGATGGDGDGPPTSWVGDKLMVGSFAHRADANYDGKYFRTPGGELYLLFSKRLPSSGGDGERKRDGVAALPLSDPRTVVSGSAATFLLVPGEDGLRSENYITANDSFRLVETGNVRAVNGKFVMAYSVGAFFNQSYKLSVAYSDTFLPAPGKHYRKVMKENPDRLWGSTAPKEVYYLLQADQKHAGWRYVGDRVLAPGVPTVAHLGAGDGWVLTFAGYDPDDAPRVPNTNKYMANYRRPYFININVKVPDNISVAEASDAELQRWITPVQEGNGSTLLWDELK